MSIKLSTKRKWSRRVTRLKKAAIEHKDWTGIWGLWLLTQSSAILFKSLQDSIPLMLSIYRFFGSLQPSVTANPLLRALYANLLFWPIPIHPRRQPTVAFPLFEPDNSATLAPIKHRLISFFQLAHKRLLTMEMSLRKV